MVKLIIIFFVQIKMVNNSYITPPINNTAKFKNTKEFEIYREGIIFYFFGLFLSLIILFLLVLFNNLNYLKSDTYDNIFCSN